MSIALFIEARLIERQKDLIRRNYPNLGLFYQSLILCDIMRLYGIKLDAGHPS